MSRATPTGRESPFNEDEIIVTKTDTKSNITYANEVFLRVSQLTREQALGQPHNIIRHPNMPGCIFQLMWQTIQGKGEFFGYVVNLASNGNHYWVFAHVTASLDPAGNLVGFHSMRRKPEPAQVAKIQPIYQALLAEESRHTDRRQGMAQARTMFNRMLSEKQVTYDEFAFSL